MIHVLVVEDDFAIAESICEALREEGYRVARARDGAEALTLLGGGLRPLVLLLDWMLPRVDGSSVLDHIRSDRRLGGVPTILVTASPDTPRDVPTVRKPFRLDDLLDAVADAIRQVVA